VGSKSQKEVCPGIARWLKPRSLLDGTGNGKGKGKSEKARQVKSERKRKNRGLKVK
jgi:hypothetical protein